MVGVMEKPGTPLPEPGPFMSPADHLQMCQRLVEHTAIERAKKNRLQTSEKIWGSVAHAINAVGKWRGWIAGEKNIQLQDVVSQLGAELDEANSTRKRRRRRRRNRGGNDQPTKQDEFQPVYGGAVDAL